MDTLHCSTSFHCSTPLHCSTSLHCFTCQHCSTSFFEGALRCDNIMFLLIQESIPAISPARLLQTVYPSELLGTDSLMKDALQVSVMSSAHSLPPHSPPLNSPSPPTHSPSPPSILPLLPLILPLLPSILPLLPLISSSSHSFLFFPPLPFLFPTHLSSLSNVHVKYLYIICTCMYHACY